MLHANPLLQPRVLPAWSDIRAEHLVPAIESIIADNRAAIAEIVATQALVPTWDDLVVAVDETDARLDEAMAVIETLDLVQHNSAAWTQASALCTEAEAQYKREKAGNVALFVAYQRLADSSIAKNFDDSRKAALSKILRGYALSGIHLPVEQQQQLADIDAEIGRLEDLFMSNLDSASEAWSKHIDDVETLKGLPRSTIDRLALQARQAGHDGWRVSLDQDTFRQVMAFAENRALREEYFLAYATRASDQGPHNTYYDNGPVLARLLDRRHQKARLLGHDNYAQLSLANRMVNATEQVSEFLRQQVAREAPLFAKEARAVEAMATRAGISRVEPWDHLFYAEKLRHQHREPVLADLRAWFPLDGTLLRLRLLCERMFGIRIVEQTAFERWHSDVRLFEISEHGQLLGHVYLDPFHRPQALDFAWTATPRNRRMNAEGRPTTPIAILYSNFTAVAEDEPCLLTHRDLRVLFHEFGHCLQHVLTRTPHYNLSGISQFERDTAEFSGQFFELWCQSPEIYRWLAAHHKTAERLTKEQAERALAAIQATDNWQVAILTFSAMLDFELHRCQGDGRSVQQIFEQVQQQIPYLQLPPLTRFANALDHMVTGYDASVYGYKWSGVLASEAFKRFENNWVFNAKTGRAFRETVMAPGDSRSLQTSVSAFIAQADTPVTERAPT